MGKITISVLIENVSGYKLICCCLFSRRCTSCSTDTEVAVDRPLVDQSATWLTAVTVGLSKNRWDDDGTGPSIPPAAGGHIVALMTRRGGRRVDGTAWQATTGQLGNMFSNTNVGLCITSANLKYDKQVINFFKRSMMNIVHGHQRKAMDLKQWN